MAKVINNVKKKDIYNKNKDILAKNNCTITLQQTNRQTSSKFVSVSIILSYKEIIQGLIPVLFRDVLEWMRCFDSSKRTGLLSIGLITFLDLFLHLFGDQRVLIVLGTEELSIFVVFRHLYFPRLEFFDMNTWRITSLLPSKDFNSFRGNF